MMSKVETNNDQKPEQSSYEKMQQATDKPTDSTVDKTNQAENVHKPTQEIDILQEQFDELTSQLQEAKKAHTEDIKDKHLRHLAEIKNLQDRQHREVGKARDYAIQSFAKDLLSIADALHQGIDTADDNQKQGLQLILNVFDQTLAKHHIQALDPKGKPYDPHEHEAMAMHQDKNTPDNHIIQVVQIGYKLNDRILRPARVIVAKNG